ncbi:MAG: T9SS type A sorting domain-containing protein [Fidelibacterota bacterium]
MTSVGRFLSMVVVFTPFLASTIPASASPDNLQDDYRKGHITREEYLIYEIARLRSRPEIPEKYRTEKALKCATPIWKLLMGSAPFLSPSSRGILEAMRVDFSRSFPTAKRPTGLDRKFDPPSGFFRFHYTTGGQNGVDPSDLDRDGVPDYVNRVAEAFITAYVTQIDSFGLTPPPGDGWYADNGGDGRYDIYIYDLGPNYYGETVPEDYANDRTGDNENSSRTEENAFTSFISIRNSFSGFPKEELQSIQVTAAHEFFHAVQFGYDGWEATWMLEASATWMEDEVFDDVNDNYQYLKLWLQQPHIALDEDISPHWYGSWIFFRYLSEHLGGAGTIRKIFEESVGLNSQTGDLSIVTIDRVLSRMGSGFSHALASMVIANQVLSSDAAADPYTYEEASSYRLYGIKPAYKKSVVLSDTLHVITSGREELNRNASHYIELLPASGPLEVSLFPASSFSDFQVKAIIQATSGDVVAFDVRRTRTVTIPPDLRQMAIAVVSDTTRDVDYGYTLTLQPKVLLPSRITLFQNFPNPFNEMTTFRFFLPEVHPVSLSIVDLRGRRVEKVAVSEVREGFNDTRFQGRHLPSGVYFLTLEANGEIRTRKFTVIK